MDEQPTNQVPSQPQQPTEKANLVSETLAASQTPVPTNQPAVGQPLEPKKKGLPAVVWVLIIFGVISLLLSILVVVVLIIFNPLKTAKDLGKVVNLSIVEDVSGAVQKCIDTEKTKGTVDSMIYSKELCANSSYLVRNGYYTSGEDVILTLSVNPLNTKICVFMNLDTVDPFDSTENLVSWDSDSQSITDPGKGTKDCD